MLIYQKMGSVDYQKAQQEFAGRAVEVKMDAQRKGSLARAAPLMDLRVKPPGVIWLQWYGKGYGDVTWCRDQVFDEDILYERVVLKRRQRNAKGNHRTTKGA